MNLRSITLALTLGFIASAYAGPGAFLTLQDAGDADSGYGVGFMYDFALSPQASIDARVSYQTGYKVEGWWEEDLAVIPIEANFNWKIPLYGWTPYFGAGVGYYYFDPDWIEAEIGYNLHAGVLMDTGRGVSLFGEVKHLVLEPEGADFGGFGLTAGIAWGF